MMKIAIAAALAASLASGSIAQAPTTGSTAPQLNVTTATALELADYATKLAASRKMKICIAVSDADGNLVAFTRMQGAYAGCVDASIAKAKSAARFSVNTLLFYDLARKENLAIGTIPGILPAVGGVILKQNGVTVGSVGVSGDQDLTEQALAEDTAKHFQ